jgi:adenylate cyclase
VNKFEGDGALCVFGAPLAHDDAACAALQAARDMQARLRRDVPEAPAMIGVSAGVVVAGNVGARDRLEYTVIGDPVNEAARLTELAKEHDSGICASEAAVARVVDDAERARWSLGEPVVLRGRGEATRVAVPA